MPTIRKLGKVLYDPTPGSKTQSAREIQGQDYYMSISLLRDLPQATKSMTKFGERYALIDAAMEEAVRDRVVCKNFC